MNGKNWRWLAKPAVLALHAEAVDEHGGGAGLRDEGLLESALARPQNLVAYGTPSAAELAASYAFGIARNHPFVDGNKRTALIAGALFLELNGHSLVAPEAEAAAMFVDLAAGLVDEESLAAWFAQNIEGHIASQ